MASRIVLKASDVAAIIGHNKYKPRKEVLDDLWKKYSPETFTGKTKKDRAYEAIRASDTALEVIEKATAIKARDSDQVQAVFTEARDILNSDPKLNDEQKTEAIEHLRSRVYTTHGTRSEDRTSVKVETDEGVRLVRDNSFYTYDVCTIEGTKFVVVGKIDRIEEKPDGSRVLVEIKNRTNRLFKQVVDYEMIQIQVYLQMLGLIRARLVEQYNTRVLSHEIVRNEELWDNVIRPGLEEFCRELHMNINRTVE